MWVTYANVFVRSTESGCSMWGHGTSLVWKVTWCQWAAPGWNCLLPPTAESSPSTGPTACEHTRGCKWSDVVAVHVFSFTTEGAVCLLVSQLSSCLPLSLSHDRRDKCLQGIANATISGMTSHTTCMYFSNMFVFAPAWHNISSNSTLCYVTRVVHTVKGKTLGGWANGHTCTQTQYNV